ncbi:MAG: homoserine O-succinyltransferase [Litoreibacter sp.]
MIINAEIPAHYVLENEGLRLKTGDSTKPNWMEPLRIGIVNLMPKKIETETQLARLLGSSPFPVQLEFIRLDGHKAKNTPNEHLEAFYRPFSTIIDEHFDGLIITGAPIEHLRFEDVDYWDELCVLMDWLQSNVYSTMGICWGAMALAYHRYGLPKYALPKKVFGCFEHHRMTKYSQFLSGFSDGFYVPISRHTEVRQTDIDQIQNLNTLLVGDEGGPALVEDTANRSLFVFNHFEYDWDTLKEEYERDVKSGLSTAIPASYFPSDDPSQDPVNNWCWQGQLLFWNWLAVLAKNQARSKKLSNHYLPYAV